MLGRDTQIYLDNTIRAQYISLSRNQNHVYINL
jgi:hypothetical protein